MRVSDDAVIRIEHAEPAGDFKLSLLFNDGTRRTVDFGPFLRGSGNPLIREYLNPATFARFEVKDGDVVWGDYDLCFPVADLYDGQV